MAGDCIGRDAEGAEHVVQGVGRKHRLKTAAHEDVVAPGRQLGQVQAEAQRQLAEIGVDLVAQAGKQEGQLAAGAEQAIGREENVLLAAPGQAARDDAPGLGQAFGRGLEQHQPARSGARMQRAAVEVRQQTGRIGPRQRQEGFLRGQPALPRLRLQLQRRRHAHPRRHGRRAHDQVRVDSAKAEGAHAGQPVRTGLPGRGVPRHVEALSGQLGPQFTAVQGRRQDAIAEGAGGLDDAGDAGRAQRMANHRLDRPKCHTPPFHMRPEETQQRTAFHLVAARHAGAVALDVAGAARIDAGVAPGGVESLDLAFGTRRQQAFGAAVAATGDAFDHGMNAVAMRQRRRQRLEHHQAGAFAQQETVGTAVERPDLFLPRQRADVGEHRPVTLGQRNVHAAGQHHLAAAQLQLHDGVFDRYQRRRAGGIEDVAWPCQVEPVGQACGGKSGDQVTRKAALEAGLALGHETLGEGVEPGLVQPWKAVAQALAQLRQKLDAVEEANRHRPDRHGAAEDHAHRQRRLFPPAARNAGIGQRAAGQVEHEELVGLGLLDFARYDAVLERIEAQVRHHAGAAAIGLLQPGRAARHEITIVPAPALRHRIGADGVDTALDIVPEGGKVRRLGKAA